MQCEEQSSAEPVRSGKENWGSSGQPEPPSRSRFRNLPLRGLPGRSEEGPAVRKPRPAFSRPVSQEQRGCALRNRPVRRSWLGDKQKFADGWAYPRVRSDETVL